MSRTPSLRKVLKRAAERLDARALELIGPPWPPESNDWAIEWGQLCAEVGTAVAAAWNADGVTMPRLGEFVAVRRLFNGTGLQPASWLPDVVEDRPREFCQLVAMLLRQDAGKFRGIAAAAGSDGTDIGPSILATIRATAQNCFDADPFEGPVSRVIGLEGCPATSEPLGDEQRLRMLLREELDRFIAPRVEADRRETAEANANGVEDLDLVDLDQIAGMVHKKKKTLESRVREMPAPHVRGGSGRPHLWKWAEVLPWLEKEYVPGLPKKYPGNVR